MCYKTKCVWNFKTIKTQISKVSCVKLKMHCVIHSRAFIHSTLDSEADPLTCWPSKGGQYSLNKAVGVDVRQRYKFSRNFFIALSKYNSLIPSQDFSIFKTTGQILNFEKVNYQSFHKHKLVKFSLVFVPTINLYTPANSKAVNLASQDKCEMSCPLFGSL